MRFVIIDRNGKPRGTVATDSPERALTIHRRIFGFESGLRAELLAPTRSVREASDELVARFPESFAQSKEGENHE